MTVRPCPICRRKPEKAYDPFCSRRCADIDLHRWLSGGYAIPGSDDGEEEDGPGQSDPDRGTAAS